LQQIYLVDGVSNFVIIAEFYRRYYKNIFWSLFFWTQCIMCLCWSWSCDQSWSALWHQWDSFCEYVAFVFPNCSNVHIA